MEPEIKLELILTGVECEYLKKLVELGKFGATKEEVIKGIMDRGLQELMAKGYLKPGQDR